MKAHLTIVENRPWGLSVPKNNIVSFDTESYIKTIPKEAETYTGEYVVLPSVAEQVLDTKDKWMADDVVIEAYQTPILISKTMTANGTYLPATDNADGYNEVIINVASGLVIPEGFAYYNGYLLPQIPTDDDYDYTWIRKNEQTGNYDCIQGTSQWWSRSNASLDSWSLEFANLSSEGARQYSIPQNGDTTTATSWGEYVTSVNYYGTSNNRKVIWSSHDIMIGTSGNILYKHGIGLYPPS